jgi:uroporphyrinogen-III synthase
MRRALEALGARVDSVPVIRIVPPADPGPLEEAVGHLAEYDWVVFTSRNAVRAVRACARRLGVWPHLPPIRVACIGPATARAARAAGFSVVAQPVEYVAEALVDALARVSVDGCRVLLPRAEEARDVLPQGLAALGARVDVVAAYRTEPAYNEAERLRRVLRSRPDLVTFASPSAVRAAVQLVADPAVLRSVPVACIGPVTAAEAARQGLRVVAVADSYTEDGLVRAVFSALRPDREGGT